MESFDLKNVICVNLRKGQTNKRLSPTRIRFICDYFELNSEVIIKLAEKYCKLWIVTKFEGGAAVIYTADSISPYANYDLFTPFDKLPREVRVAVLQIPVTFVPPTPPQTKKKKNSKIEEVKPSEVSEQELVKLDVDTILDKIGAKGMVSLTNQELDFLNGLSK